MYLAQLAWIEEHSNVRFFAPPGTGRSHLAIALATKACDHGFRVAFALPRNGSRASRRPKDRNQLETERRRLERYQLVVVDEVGCAPRGAVTSGGMRGPVA